MGMCKGTTVSVLGVAVFLLVLVMGGGPASAELKSTLAEGDDGYFKFPTTYIYEGQKIDIGGTLTFPGGASGKTPLVVIVHSADGVTTEETRWKDFWLAKGYATFMLDYMAPRGISANNSSAWPRDGEDVQDALIVLATHPRIDTDRVAIQGHSTGATAAGNSAGKIRSTPFMNWPADKIIPKAYILLYGGCAGVMMPPTARIKGTATLYLIGSEDEAARPDACKLNADSQKSQGADIKAVIFPGVYHKFDGDKIFRTSTKFGVIDMRPNSEAFEMAKQEAASLLARVFQ